MTLGKAAMIAAAKIACEGDDIQAELAFQQRPPVFLFRSIRTAADIERQTDPAVQSDDHPMSVASDPERATARPAFRPPRFQEATIRRFRS
jgi:hypothetical protein